MLTEELDRVLSEGYLAELSTLETSDLKARRADCQLVESKLSYLRRLVQGRLDIVRAEADRRASGSPPGDLSALLDKLPEILADRLHSPGPGRMPTNLVPPDDDDLTTELDAITGGSMLADLPDLSDDELSDLVDRLTEFERNVSSQRRSVFDVIDALDAELIGRLDRDA